MLPSIQHSAYLEGKEAGVAAERERCAKICDKRAALWRDRWRDETQGECSLPLEEECEDIARSIRKQ